MGLKIVLITGLGSGMDLEKKTIPEPTNPLFCVCVILILCSYLFVFVCNFNILNLWIVDLCCVRIQNLNLWIMYLC